MQMAADETTSLLLDCCDVEAYDPQLHEQLVMYPSEAITLFDQGLTYLAIGAGMDPEAASIVQVGSDAHVLARFSISNAEALLCCRPRLRERNDRFTRIT